MVERRNKIIQTILMIWASPWSALGVAFGLMGLCTGGNWQRRDRILEFYGGWITPLLRQAPITGGAAAITLGHTVLGRTAADLDRARTHELVHVCQYERWGPFFIPAYFLSSAYLILRGRDPYRENPFEREAYAVAGVE